MSFTKRQLRTYYHKRHVRYKVEDLSHNALYEFPRPLFDYFIELVVIFVFNILSYLLKDV